MQAHGVCEDVKELAEPRRIVVEASKRITYQLSAALIQDGV
jgi:hypothetical protein